MLRSVCVLFAALMAFPAVGADLDVQPIPPRAVEETAERLAILYLLRARFDVMEPEVIASQLEYDVAQIKVEGLSAVAETELDEALMAEGSYYITSLRYLIQAGGAIWPLDESAASYESRTLATLAELRHAWLSAVVSDGDLPALMLAVDQINALTEGYPEVPPDLDHFADLDGLVDAALAPDSR